MIRLSPTEDNFLVVVKTFDANIAIIGIFVYCEELYFLWDRQVYM